MIMMAFDTETTGLTSNRLTRLDLQPEVIEFAGVVFNADTEEVLDQLDFLCKPSRSIPEKVTSMTGISDADVADQPPFSTFADQCFSFIERQPIVTAHNLSFDMEILDLEADRLGRKIAWPRGICTVEQSMHITGFRIKLGDLHERLVGERFKDAHRAIADVMGLVRVCCALRKRGDL